MNTFSHVPPGFRFHPTDEELVDYYLRKKIASKRIDLDVIKDVDLYKIEPWDLQELCKIGSEDENEWYFFSHKDKKYPTGTRTNRATKAGFWKATGRDKAIYKRHSLVGMRKTLVFYKGRAPNGMKSDWIMHEYRLETNENATPQEEGWVVCRVFKKRLATVQRMGDYESPCWYDDQVSNFMPDQLDSPRRSNALINPYHHQNNNNNNHHHHHQNHPHHYSACKQELELHYNNNNNMTNADPFFQLPQLESPKVPYGSTLTQEDQQVQSNTQHNNLMNSLFSITNNNNNNNEQGVDQVTDWRVLDKFVASQLSHDDHGNITSKETSNYSVDNSNEAVFHVPDHDHHQHMNFLANNDHHDSIKRSEVMHDYVSTSTSHTCQIDLWK